jgi:AraC-like DNA-binding protein
MIIKVPAMLTVIKIGIVFAIFTILSFLIKRPFGRINVLVILFMIALIYPMIPKLFPPGMNNKPPWIFEIFMAAPFTFGPFLFLYTKTETGLMKECRFTELVHFIPFIIISITMIIIFTISYNENFFAQNVLYGFHPEYRSELLGGFFPELDFINEYAVTTQPMRFSPGFRFIHKATGVLIYVSFIFYTLLIIGIISKHNKKVTDYFSTDSFSTTLKWIKWITLCFFLSYFFVFIVEIFFHEQEPVHELFSIPDVANTFFIFTFSFFSINQPVLYTEGYDDNNGDFQDDKAEKKYEKSGLKQEEAEQYYKMIIDYMNSEKPYINPDLTLNQLSEKLGIPRHHITQVINEKFNKNFFMFINEYRINEVKKRMLSEESNEYSILRIAFESGFNSKSAFNNTFKRTTGITPSEFRKSTSNSGLN